MYRQLLYMHQFGSYNNNYYNNQYLGGQYFKAFLEFALSLSHSLRHFITNKDRHFQLRSLLTYTLLRSFGLRDFRPSRSLNILFKIMAGF